MLLETEDPYQLLVRTFEEVVGKTRRMRNRD